MLHRLQLVLLIFLPNILTLPMGTNMNKFQNEIDRENTEIHKHEKIMESEITNKTVTESFDGMRQEITSPKTGASWLISPIVQKVSINAQNLFRDRLNNLKNSFDRSLTKQNITSKNLPQSLLQMVGLNDAEFLYTQNEPAGVFGGNGWLANKGGILGGPGAILSTGSLLTDYPTAYKK